MDINEGRIEANGVDFAYLEAGEGPLALCLHGFPDSAHTWRHLLPELADAGYHAVAPWLRGYAPTAIPADGLYQPGALAADANGLHAALGGADDAVLVGHDWGAFATYTAAALEPDRWRRIVTLAVPPPGAVAASVLSYDQMHRSWYMFFFQSPIADLLVPMDDLAFLDRLWAAWSPGYDATADLAHVKDSLRDPANLAAALGYYRAAFGAGSRDADLDAAEARAGATGGPSQPALYLHGADDGCFGADIVAGVGDLLTGPGSRMEMIPDSGHFLHLEKPQIVDRLIVDFLQA